MANAEAEGQTLIFGRRRRAFANYVKIQPPILVYQNRSADRRHSRLVESDQGAGDYG